MIVTPARLELAHDLEHALHLVHRQRRGRFVHDQDLDVLGDRLGDFHDLLLRRGQVAHQGVGVDLDGELLKTSRARLDHHLGIDDQPLPGFVAQKDVFGHRHRRHQVEFLVDDLHAQAARQVRRHLGVLLPADVDDAAVRLDGAGDGLDQRGFARAVLAQQRMHLPCYKIEGNPVKGKHARILLGDVL